MLDERRSQRFSGGGFFSSCAAFARSRRTAFLVGTGISLPFGVTCVGCLGFFSMRPSVPLAGAIKSMSRNEDFVIMQPQEPTFPAGHGKGWNANDQRSLRGILLGLALI